MSRYNRLYRDRGVEAWPLVMSRYRCDTVGGSTATQRRGARVRAAIRPPRLVTRQGQACDTAGPGLRHGTVRAAWVQCARPVRAGWVQGVHLDQPSFGLSALFQSLFGPLFMNTFHKFFQKKIKKNKKNKKK